MTHWPGEGQTQLNKETLVEGSSLSFTKYALYTKQHATPNTSSLHSVFARLKTILVSRRVDPEGCRETRFEIAAMLYFLSYPSSSLKYSDNQWPDSKQLEQNWEIHFHHHQGQTLSTTHVIQCRILVRPGYFINRVRLTRLWPDWPGRPRWPDPVSTLVQAMLAHERPVKMAAYGINNLMKFPRQVSKHT